MKKIIFTMGIIMTCLQAAQAQKFIIQSFTSDRGFGRPTNTFHQVNIAFSQVAAGVMEAEDFRMELGILTHPIFRTHPVPVDTIEMSFALLGPNYPNPFQTYTRIPVEVLKADAYQREVEVDVSIFDLQGKHIKQLFSGVLAPGTYEFFWDAKTETGMKVAPGLYVYRLATNNKQIAANKMKLLYE